MRHLHPCTKEPRWSLWLGLLLILGGMFGLLLLFTGCGSAAVSAGPAVGGSSGLGYDGASCGVQAVADRPGLRVSGHASTARKAGSDDAGGAELRILSGLGGPSWALWYGLRGAVQRADYGTVAVWNPTLGAPPGGRTSAPGSGCSGMRRTRPRTTRRRCGWKWKWAASGCSLRAWSGSTSTADEKAGATRWRCGAGCEDT